MAKKLIFVCVGNSCRSQMAEGFFNHYAQERKLSLRAESAGIKPAGYVHPNAIAVMAEVGIDISNHRSKGITPQRLLNYEIVITMGCSDKNVCPATFRGDSRDWGIDDPFDQAFDVYRRVRDQIEEKVLALLKELSNS
jgi:protein-tyrosine-phosphatase